jgi:hypothetical protein
LLLDVLSLSSEAYASRAVSAALTTCLGTFTNLLFDASSPPLLGATSQTQVTVVNLARALYFISSCGPDHAATVQESPEPTRGL